LELRDLEAFVALGEELHFTKAAERLRMSQPRLSQMLKRMEEDLAVHLVARTRRRVELTEAGRVLLEEARRTLAQARTAVSLTQSAHSGHSGTLHVGFLEASVHWLLPSAVRSFRGSHPGVDVVLKGLVSAEQPAALERGDINVGILRRIAFGPDIVYEEIRKERLVLYLPRDHPLARQSRVEVTQLRDEAFVYTPRRISPDLFDQVLGIFLARGFSPHIVQEATELQTVLALVAAGIGVTVAVESLKPMGGRHVVTRTLDDPSAWVSIGLAWNRNDRNPALPAFLNVVRSQLWR
jgi:DNA-binding transcriptional LysR family regulator